LIFEFDVFIRLSVNMKVMNGNMFRVVLFLFNFTEFRSRIGISLFCCRDWMVL